MLRGSVAALAALVLFVLPAVASPEYAPAGITLAELFARNEKSTGSHPTGTYRVVSRSVSRDGNIVTIETLSSNDDFKSTMREGDFAWSWGEYHGRRWHQDANGLVLPSSNFSAENDPFAVALRRTQDSAGGVRLLGLTGDSPAAFVVEVAPAQGLREHLYYDAQTYLLSRRELVDYDGHRQVWIYREYRPESGATIAHAIDYEADGTAVTTRTAVLVYQRVNPSAVDLSIPESKPLFDLAGRDAVEIPARFTVDGIFVTVSIGGRGLDFILDSGSSELLIDPSVAREMGMASTGAQRWSFAGDVTVANTRAPDFTVGPLSARGVALSTAAYEMQLPGQRIVGLLGADFIGSGALSVDFQKNRLTLLRVRPPNLAEQGWSALPLRLDYGVPLLSAAYSDRPGHFIADLGAYYSMLFPHYFSAFHITVPKGTPEQGEMESLAGRPFGIYHFTMRSLVLGDWIFGGVQVVVPTVDYAQDRDYDGLIGRDTLCNFNLIFDYKDGQLWFKPIAGDHT